MSQKTPIKLFLTFLFFAVLAWAPLLYADALININTADLAALETLNGIGPSKGQAIIDYRTQKGPFAKIEDVMNVSGIGTATFNNIKNFITVSSADPQTQTAATSSAAASSAQTQTQAQSQNQIAGNGPPPITARITADSRTMAGGGSYFSAAAYGTESLPLPNPRFMWNFGDGAVAEGARVFHTYSYPGRYAVSVTAAYNYSSGMDRMVIEAVSAAVSLVAEGDGSLLLRNNSSQEINIGLWSLVDSGKSYGIPEGTIVLAGEGVRFAASVIGLSGTPGAALLYPNGTQAASATVAQDSPLRGERVTKNQLTPLSSKVAPIQSGASDTGEVLGESTSSTPAGAGASGGSLALWGSVAALAGLLAVGGTGAFYLRPRYSMRETPLTAEEFYIE